MSRAILFGLFSELEPPRDSFSQRKVEVVSCSEVLEKLAFTRTSKQKRPQADSPISCDDKMTQMLIAYFNLLTTLLFGLILAGALVYLRSKKKKSWTYLLFFGLFAIYIFKVLDYTLLQYQSLLLLKMFAPNLMLNGQEAGQAVNLVPLISLTSGDIKTSLLNILLFVPFGFLLPFFTKINMTKVVIIGALLSISIELAQLLTGLLAKTTFRVADINDLLFNITGAAIGYGLFMLFVKTRQRASKNGRKWLGNEILR